MSCCNNDDDIYDDSCTTTAITSQVKEYYGQVLHSTKDLKTSACTSDSRPHPILQQLIQTLPKEINDRFYGCGCPVPLGIEGLTVLDLGCGTGRDCYLASKLVGPSGRVFGVDMTSEQLEVANKYAKEYGQGLGYENMTFLQGYMEQLDELEPQGLKPGSIDLIISNCVINLSPDKPRVMKHVARVLKEGGEFYFSDVYASRRIPKHLLADPVLYGECISGALYLEDFKRIAQQVGFNDIRVVSAGKIAINDYELRQLLGDQIEFYSVTLRCFKIKNLESLCEDYGQVATYLGTVKGQESSFKLDHSHVFEAKKPAVVCGNTASMLAETWLKPHFKVEGDRSVHYGLFDCGGGSCGGGSLTSDVLKAVAKQQPNSSRPPSCGTSCC